MAAAVLRGFSRPNLCFQPAFRAFQHLRQVGRNLPGNDALRARAESSGSSSGSNSVLGTLGGREIVQAGSIDPREFWVKRITKDDVIMAFSRSQGAGGQNVNKVSTKADIRFDVKNCSWLSDRVKAALMQRESTRMNKQGELLISSQVTRSQLNNLNDAIARLQEALDAAAESVKPIESDPDKVKKLQKLEAAAHKKRLEGKKMQSDKKKMRSNKNFD